MEIIRKQINLNDYVSRTPALVPYIKTDVQGDGYIHDATNRNGSWGGIMCDYTENGETTANLFRRYFRLKEIARNGLKLKKIESSDGRFYIDTISEYVRGSEFVPKSRSMFECVGKGVYKQVEDDSDRFAESYIRAIPANDYIEYQELGGAALIDQVEDMIGIIEIPSTFKGSKVPEYMYLSELDAWIDWFEVNHGYKYMIIPQSAYDSAPADEKAEYTGSLPVHIGSESPKYAKLTRSVNLPSGQALRFNYYKKVEAEPEDCCLRQEWDERGGAAFWKYLVTKRGMYSDKIKTWQTRMQEGQVTVPTISVPILLTQVYDDNGVMSAVGEDLYTGNESKTVYEYREVPYSSIPSHLTGTVETVASVPANPGPTDFTYIKVGSKYYFLFPILYVDEGPFQTVSKLSELRTRERVYDDYGNVLPFVNLRSSGDGYVADMPYRVNEVKNLGIDVNGKRSYGDYIDSISSSETAVTFTYYIGGEYDASKGVNINLNKAIGESGSEGKSFSVTITAAKQWALLSISGDWIQVVGLGNNERQAAGTKTVTIRATENNGLDVRTGSVTFGVVAKGYYEEVTFSIVQQPSTSDGVINFNGTSNYVVKFGSLAGTTGGTYNSTTGLTNYFNVVCRNSAWYMKSKCSWLTVEPVRGEENVATRLTVKATLHDGPRRECDIVLVAVGDPKVTKTLKVIQSDGKFDMRYVIDAIPDTYTIEYGQTSTCHVCMEVHDGSAVSVLGLNSWSYDIIGGDPSLFRVVRENGNNFKITNCNNTGQENTLLIKVYPNAAPELYKGISFIAKPKVEAKRADIYLYANRNIIEYGKSEEFGVYLVGKNGNNVNMADWEYDCNPPYSQLKNYCGIFTDKTAHTLTIKNANTSGQEQNFDLWAYYTQDNTIRSSAVTVTLKGPERYTVQGTLYLAENYKAFACVQIWPSNENGTNGAYASSSNWPGATFQGGWSGTQIIKPPTGRCKIKVFNGVYGNVNQFKVTLKKKDGSVGWYSYMRYDVEDSFKVADFEYDGGLYIDVYIEQA